MFDHGPEANLGLWEQAVGIIDGFVHMVAHLGEHENEAAVVALIDARERAREEARRAKVEVDMRCQWASSQPKEAELL
jgi:hypothetical protein